MNTGNSREGRLNIDYLEIAKVLLKKIWIILLAAVLFGAGSFAYTYYNVTPLYSSAAMLYVNSSSVNIGNASLSLASSDLNVSKGLISTYSVILKSRLTLNDVIDRMGLPYSYEQLKNMIIVGPVEDTAIFSIKVTDPDPELATQIANTLADILSEKITSVIEGSSVRVVDYAVTAGGRVGPDYTKNIMTGALAGAVLCAAVIVLLYLMDDTITSDDYLKNTYSDVPVLGVIPNLAGNKTSGYYQSYEATYDKTEQEITIEEDGEENV